MDILKLLEELDIDYALLEHKAVFTCEESAFVKKQMDGVGIKNLFLKDKKKNYYLLSGKDTKPVDLKALKEKLNTSRLSFASEEELKEVLNLSRGSVTPLGIVNDKQNLVTIVLDAALSGEKLLVHPLTNTRTISIAYQDLIKFIEHQAHRYIEIPL